MASTAEEPHLPALGAHQREDVGNRLQATLVELIDLSLLGKRRSVVEPVFDPTS